MNTLIIKTGAAGDVVRTTCLLRVLDGSIYWLCTSRCAQLLPADNPRLTIIRIEEDLALLNSIRFDLVISLEEDLQCAQIAGAVQSSELTGIYLKDGRLTYTDSARDWYDMSRISRYGLEQATRLKARNQLSYQELLFRMAGLDFNAEQYSIYRQPIHENPVLIGIEKRCGPRWPNKNWWGYDMLAEKLRDSGIPYKIFAEKADIRNYADDIASCSHVVSGDTLAMHIALAYGKRCTAIFNCTSPQEIYDYGTLRKIISPLLEKYYYATSENADVVNSVGLKEVLNALLNSSSK